MDVFDVQAALILPSKDTAVSNLLKDLCEALDSSNLDEAALHLLEYRLRCGYNRTQQRELFQAYRMLFAWSVEQERALPYLLVDTDMDSTEGLIINQVLVELVISTPDSTTNDTIAQLCEQMCRAIIRHGVKKDEVTKRWTQQGIPPLLLARRPFFSQLREQQFMGDLGL